MFKAELIPILKEIHNRQREIATLMEEVKPRSNSLEERHKNLLEEKERLNRVSQLLDEVKEVSKEFVLFTNRDKTLMQKYHALARAEYNEDYIECAKIKMEIENYKAV